jgi:hypothetical protein
MKNQQTPRLHFKIENLRYLNVCIICTLHVFGINRDHRVRTASQHSTSPSSAEINMSKVVAFSVLALIFLIASTAFAEVTG